MSAVRDAAGARAVCRYLAARSRRNVAHSRTGGRVRIRATRHEGGVLGNVASVAQPRVGSECVRGGRRAAWHERELVRRARISSIATYRRSSTAHRQALWSTRPDMCVHVHASQAASPSPSGMAGPLPGTHNACSPTLASPRDIPRTLRERPLHRPYAAGPLQRCLQA